MSGTPAHDRILSPYEANEDLLADMRFFVDLACECANQERGRLTHAWQSIVARMSATVEAGVFLPWLHLALVFRLTALDQQLLLLAWFAELDDPGSKRLQSPALWDPTADGISAESRSTTDRHVSLDVACRLLGDIRTHLLPDAPLVRNFLLETSQANLVTMTGSYRLSPPLLPYLLAIAAPQPTIDETALTDLIEDCELSEHLIDEPAKRQLTRFIEASSAGSTSPTSFVLHLEGADTSMMESLSAATFGPLGYSTAKLDARLLRRAYERADARRSTFATQVRILCCDGLLCNQVLVLVNCEALTAESAGGNARGEILELVLQTILETHRYLVIVNGPADDLNEAFRRSTLSGAVRFRIRISPPDANLRRQAWDKHSHRYGLQLEDDTLAQLATGFPFTEEQIASVAKDTASRQMLDDAPNGAAGLVTAACRAEAEAGHLDIVTALRWPYRIVDIVVPSQTREMLGELTSHVKHRHRVVETWGFGHKYAGARNLSALFFGPSGAGKTMAASIVANELDLSLYRVDLANVLNKYIGETEKNLARLFDRAADMNSVLFFDEAEGLFAKRSDSRDSNDRFINLQVGYLLQRIETYPGLVILATNLLGNIDKAFSRRFRFIIEFPFPTPLEREALWRKAFPSQTPLADDIDFALLAHKAVLAGGSIQTAALSAAFRAAEEGSSVAMPHIVRSIEREYAKLGKLFSVGDFERSTQGQDATREA